MKIIKKKASVILGSLGLTLSLSSLPAFNPSNTYKTNKETQILKNRTNDVQFTFYVGKSSGIPFGGKDIITWSIYGEDGNYIRDIDDVDDSKVDGKITIPLPYGNYTARVKFPLVDTSHYIVPPNEVPFTPENTKVNLTYIPELYDNTPPTVDKYMFNNVLYNYKFNDVFNKGISLERNRSAEKLTIMMFMKTSCRHSQLVVKELNNLINRMNWHKKLDVWCISWEDSEYVLQDFSKSYSPAFKFVDIDKATGSALRDMFVTAGGYPSLAFIDYQGVFDNSSTGDVFESFLEENIRRFSKPGFLDSLDSSIKEPITTPFEDLEENEIPNISFPDEDIPEIIPDQDLPASGELPTTLEELKHIRPEAIAKASRYDSRDYKIVSSVKNQHSEGICWAYAGAAVADTNVLRQGLVKNPADVNFSPNNIDFSAKKRNASYNIMSMNKDDIEKKGTGAAGSARIVDEVYSTWSAPVNDFNLKTGYVQPSFYLTDSEYFMSQGDPEWGAGVHLTADEQNKIIKKMKYGIAKYGALSYDSNVQVPLLKGPAATHYNNNNTYGSYSGHALTVIGWDDSIKADSFGPTPATRDGAWIIKDSWGEDSHDYMKGFFYMSYDSSFGSSIGYKFTDTKTYDNNYHWDIGANGHQDNSYAKNESCAIYPVEKANFDIDEYLKAVNVSFTGYNTTVDFEIYNNVKGVDRKDPFASDINPRNGTLVDSFSQTYEYGGTKTVKLKKPIKLERDQYFSIIVRVHNADNTALLSTSIDPSFDDMTYALVNDKWVNYHTNQNDGTAVARIRAFTKEYPIEGATSNSLNNAIVKLDNQKMRFGDESTRPNVASVKIGKTYVDPSKYDVKYEPLVLNKTANATSKEDEVIGHGTITITGKDGYTGVAKVDYDVMVGISPSLQGLGWYTKNYYGVPRVANFRVKNSALKYKDIPIPEGFEWMVSPDTLINFENPATLTYKGVNKEYYRHTFFEPSNSTLVLYHMESDDFEPIPDVDPAFDLTKADITIRDGNIFEYTGSAIKPRVDVWIGDNLLTQDSDYILEYDNNVDIGTATIIVKAKSTSDYQGKQTLNFEIVKGENTIIDFHLDENNNPVARSKEGHPTFKYYRDAACKDYIGNDKPVKVGTYYVTAVSPETGNYKSVTQGPLQLTILPDGKLDFSAVVVNVTGNYTYNESPIKPTLNVSFRGMPLQENRDYIIEDLNNTDANVNATVRLVGKDKYYGEKIAAFTIEKAWNRITSLKIVDGSPRAEALHGTPQLLYYEDPYGNYPISAPTSNGTYYVDAMVPGDKNWRAAYPTGAPIKWIKGSQSETKNIANTDITILNQNNLIYNKSAIEPQVRVTYYGTELVKGSDYEVSYSNNYNAGNNAKVIITGKGAYTGTKEKFFTIKKAKNVITDFKLTDNIPSANCIDGTVEFAYFHDKDCNQYLGWVPTSPGTYYVLAYSPDTTNYERTYTDKANALSFTISGDTKSLKRYCTPSIPLDQKTFTYTGKEFTPDITITLDATGEELRKDVDYKVTYKNNVEVSTNGVIGTVIATGIGDYTGELKAYFTIEKAVNEITRFDIVEKEVIATTKFDEPIIEYFEDEACKRKLPEQPTRPGKYYVRVKSTETNNYTSEYRIKPYVVVLVQKPIDSAKVTVKGEYEYNGSAIIPDVDVVLDGKLLELYKDYEIVCTNNTHAGNVAFTINGINEYNGFISSRFTIKQAQNTIEQFDVMNNNVTARSKFGKPTIEYFNDEACLDKLDEKPIDVGRYYVKVTTPGNSDYASVTETRPFEVALIQESISSAYISVEGSYTYSGKEIIPIFTVRLGSKELVKDTDYTASYLNNTNAGTATINIIGINKYKGDTSTKFIINKAVNTITSFEVNGTEVIATALDGTSPIIEYYHDRACTNKISNKPTIPGNYFVKVTTRSSQNYIAKSDVKEFNVPKFNIQSAIIRIDDANCIFDGRGLTPFITITFNNQTLIRGEDYTIKTINNINVTDDSKVIISGINNYEGSVTKTFHIHKSENRIITFDVNRDDVCETQFGGETIIEYFSDSACTKSLGIDKPTKSGTYWAKVTTSGGENYNSVTETRKVTVTNKNVLNEDNNKSFVGSPLFYSIIGTVAGIILLVVIIVKSRKHKSKDFY